MPVKIKQINTSSETYPALLALRNKILRQPLGLSLYEEDLSGEENEYILTAVENGRMIGCVLLQIAGEKTLKLRQMAVDTEFQGKGLGKELVEKAEALGIEHGFEKMMLHARITAKAFYIGLGYEPYGDEFEEVTIPHIAMQKPLS